MELDRRRKELEEKERLAAKKELEQKLKVETVTDSVHKKPKRELDDTQKSESHMPLMTADSRPIRLHAESNDDMPAPMP